eukprot:213177-Prorocentrum_lima.AAC.1
MMLEALQDATDVNINGGWRSQAAWLPAPWGGLGLRSFMRHTHAARLGAWYQTAANVNDNLQADAFLGTLPTDKIDGHLLAMVA